jgi:hypothetical protein
MNQYREYIKDLAKQGKSVVFYNSGPDHAALVMATIFATAKDTIRVFAGNFSGEISSKEEYRNGLENFLSRGGKIKVLLEKEKFESRTEEPKIFDILRFYSIINPKNVEVKKHSNKLFRAGEEKEKNQLHEIHFTVADGKMYRVEDDTKSFTAFGNFNDAEASKNLSLIFDDIFNDITKSEPVHLILKK